MDSEFISDEFAKLYEGSKNNLEQSESKLKRRFHKSGILEELGYEEDDIKVEKSDERGKRTDIHCTDEYGNVRVVVEFKKPDVSIGAGKHKKQLVDRYMKPLKADFGMLYNGLQLIAFSRDGLSSSHLFTKRADDLGEKANEIIKLGQKPDYSLTKIKNVREYFDKFDEQEEKLKLEEKSARNHFFENFKLEKNSSFENLLLSTINLFDEMKGENQFLDSAFRFWKESYAKKPEEVPSSWEDIMDRSGLSGKEDLYEFMFCLETSYAVFARLIMAKSGEDYDFSDANFSRFIETEVDRASRRGDIAGASWAKVTQELIGDMRDNLVSSVFEEDIFYWWTEPYEERSYDDLFHVKKIENETIKFGTSLGKIILMIYKFNFSRIDGDPLGVLYQQYFDKETRKALGEFYTPQEVVDYILDSVDYEGRQVLDKRLLDPACGSGTFPVTALQRYLNAAESSGRAEDEGWDTILDELCNQYRIVGFDIHPFATIMAQIQFMLVLMPYYKKAIEDAKDRGDHFKIQRIPIFRTDSLKDESKGENPTLDQFEEGEKFKMDVKLPVNKEEGGDFFDEEFAMPTPQAARKVGLINNQQYFGALQAFFDIIKQQAAEMEDRDEIPQFAREDFEDRLKKYSLTDKDWHKISTLFQSFADNLLTQINTLQTEFDDGRLIKSIEDIYLAALLKNEQKYDYVVGNPPYVDIQTMSSDQKEHIENNYETAIGNYDLYLPFTERGENWLRENGKLGYITPNRFAKVNYGKQLRKLLAEETELVEYIDFKDSNIFEDAVNYPAITVFKSSDRKNDNEVLCARFYSKYDFQSEGKDVLEDLSEAKENLTEKYNSHKFFDIFSLSQDQLSGEVWTVAPKQELEVLEEMKSDIDLVSVSDTKKKGSALFEGLSTGAKPTFVVKEVADLGSEVRVRSQENGELYQIEKGILKKYAEDAGKWSPQDEGFWAIFPYDEEGEPLSEKVMQEKFSSAYSYLEEFKEDLKSRTSLSKSSNWYEYSAPRSRDKYGKSKIMINGFSQHSSASLDGEGKFIFGPDIYGLPLKADYSSYEEEIVSVINSNITEFYIRQKGVVHRGATYKFEDRFLKGLPLQLEDNIVESKLEDVLKVRNLKEKIDKFPAEYYRDSGELISKILKCNSGHPDMEPSIQTTQDGMYEVEVGKRKTDSVLLDSKEKARFVKKALEGDSASKGDELEILVPRSNSDVKKILQEYEEDKEKLEEMPSVEELEEEINELVYDLYDLDEEEIEVIEDFLEKF